MRELCQVRRHGRQAARRDYAKKAAEQEIDLIQNFRFSCKYYYSKDSHGRFYLTEQDEVIELTTEEELEDRISSYINYTEEFMRVHNAKRALTFQWDGLVWLVAWGKKLRKKECYEGLQPAQQFMECPSKRLY